MIGFYIKYIDIYYKWYAVVERVLKKHTQVKVPLTFLKKCSVSSVKVLVQINYLSKSKRVAYLKVLMRIE